MDGKETCAPIASRIGIVRLEELAWNPTRLPLNAPFIMNLVYLVRLQQRNFGRRHPGLVQSRRHQRYHLLINWHIGMPILGPRYAEFGECSNRCKRNAAVPGDAPGRQIAKCRWNEDQNCVDRSRECYGIEIRVIIAHPKGLLKATANG